MRWILTIRYKMVFPRCSPCSKNIYKCQAPSLFITGRLFSLRWKIRPAKQHSNREQVAWYYGLLCVCHFVLVKSFHQHHGRKLEFPRHSLRIFTWQSSRYISCTYINLCTMIAAMWLIKAHKARRYVVKTIPCKCKILKQSDWMFSLLAGVLKNK